jgi:hypothetical protein
MSDDPVVQEVRRIRDEYAAQFNYDLQAIFADLKRSEAARDRAQAPLVQPPEPAAAENPTVRRIRFSHQ